ISEPRVRSRSPFRSSPSFWRCARAASLYPCAKSGAPSMSSDVGTAIAGVVLAAGASTRMGTNKLLLPVDGESLLRRAGRRAPARGFDPVGGVTGHEADRSRTELELLDCRIAFNPRHAEGIHSSVRTGIEAVPAESPAAVVMLADMPYVTSEMVAALVEAY